MAVLTGYEILRSTDQQSWDDLGPAAGTSFIDDTVTPGTTYYYQVLATSAGSSATSATAQATATPAIAGTPVLSRHCAEHRDRFVLGLRAGRLRLHRAVLDRRFGMDDRRRHRPVDAELP